MRPRIAPAFAVLMLLEPPGDIGRDAGIDALVAALDEIDVIHANGRSP